MSDFKRVYEYERLIAQVEAEIAANAPPSLLQLLDALPARIDESAGQASTTLYKIPSAQPQRAERGGPTKKTHMPTRPTDRPSDGASAAHVRRRLLMPGIRPHPVVTHVGGVVIAVPSDEWDAPQ